MRTFSKKHHPVFLSVKDFGAQGDGITNDRSRIQKAIKASDGKCLVFPKGTYLISGKKGLRVKNKNIDIYFEPGARLVARNCKAKAVLKISGVARDFSTLQEDAKEFDRKITVVLSLAKSLSEGDLVKITTDPETKPVKGSNERWIPVKKRNYYKGEIAEVRSVSGNKVTLKNPLNDHYTGGKAVVAKIKYVIGSLRNFCLEGDPSRIQDGVRTIYTKNYRIEGGDISNVIDTCCGNSGAFNMRVTGLTVSNFPTDMDGYGLTFGSGSTNCVADSCMLYGGTHAFTLGGHEPNRWITVSNCILDSAHDSGAPHSNKPCLATHENAQYVKFTGNLVKNGISMTCIDFELTNNTVHTHLASRPIHITADNVGTADHPGRPAKYMIIEGNTLYTSHVNNYPGLHLQADSAFAIEQLRIANNTIHGNKDGIIINQTTVETLSLGSVQINNNLVMAKNEVGIRLISNGPIMCENLDILNNNITASSYALQIEKLTCPVARYNNNNFHCIHKTASFFLSVSSDITTFFCQHNSFRADNSQDPNSPEMTPKTIQDKPVIIEGETMKLIICSGNTVDKSHAHAGFRLKATDILFSNNNLINVHGTVYLRGRHYYQVFGNGNVVSSGIKAPTSGNWKIGDRVYNTEVAAGGPLGWVYVGEEGVKWRAL